MQRYNFYKRITVYVVTIFMGLIFSLALLSSVSSRPFRIGKLPDKGKGFGCGTCHMSSNGGGARNSFGSDYEKMAIKAGETYTAGLGKRDSDEDGFTNDQEFKAKTHPGDPDSKP
jgi:hypothetical protein